MHLLVGSVPLQTLVPHLQTAPSPCVLTWSSCVCVLISFHKDTSQMGLGLPNGLIFTQLPL